MSDREVVWRRLVESIRAAAARRGMTEVDIVWDAIEHIDTAGSEGRRVSVALTMDVAAFAAAMRQAEGRDDA